jgi:hypothetical protein
MPGKYEGWSVKASEQPERFFLLVFLFVAARGVVERRLPRYSPVFRN